MIQKTIREISDAWREDKRPYVKLSTLAAYMLILENHILPKFGESNELHENDVQGFVLEKLEGGLSVKDSELYSEPLFLSGTWYLYQP